MTLNIDLEDVPFAILEAVKARILRNRRLLDLYNQQNPQPSLRPGPQLVKQGASRKGWRLQKTAAMALDGDGSLIIAWRGNTPVINDARAIQNPPPYENENVVTNQVASTINGVPATASAGMSFATAVAIYEVKNRPRGLSDFTLEYWGQCGSGGLGGGGISGGGTGGSSDDEPVGAGSYISLLWGDQTFGTTRQVVTVGATYYPRGSYLEGELVTLPGFYIGSGGNDSVEAKLEKVTANPIEPYHACIQRINGTYYYYVNGTFLFTTDPVPGVSQSIEDPVNVIFQCQSFNFTGNKISQARLTPNRARYNSSGFTPQQLPFSLT